MKTGWLDIRGTRDPARKAVIEAAVHIGLDAIVTDDTGVLADLPPTVRRVLVTNDERQARDGGCDVVAAPVDDMAGLDRLSGHPDEEGRRLGAIVEVRDQRTLDLACAAVVRMAYTVVSFTDPTKIPLEIVIAAADRSAGTLVTRVNDLEEASIVFDVLEKGSDGVQLATADANEVIRLAELLRYRTPALTMTTLTVRSIEHVGIGDRVCIDTCTHLDPDEGILIGSFAAGFALCCSETHPLPYMPTRPFRVNAGALHSYTYGVDNRTNYLSELRSGCSVLAVRADGRTRRVTVGRTKLESRPLLAIHTVAGDGTMVSLTVQNDWHVRVLAPDASVHNVTELEPGDELAGCLVSDKRHVGYPIAEFCIEK